MVSLTSPNYEDKTSKTDNHNNLNHPRPNTTMLTVQGGEGLSTTPPTVQSPMGGEGLSTIQGKLLDTHPNPTTTTLHDRYFQPQVNDPSPKATSTTTPCYTLQPPPPTVFYPIQGKLLDATS